jgi:hypothetical protein
MKKKKLNHLTVQKKTISNLSTSHLKGGTNIPFTENHLDSRCVCRTDAYLCLQSYPYCISMPC